jgi:putative ABC transport system ATP-binding protein
MDISIKNLLPIPLKERLQNRSSDIWNRELVLTGGTYAKVNAPSGSGKSTLVHILYKLRHDYLGSVQYGDTNIQALSEDALAVLRQKHISIVFQDLRLFPNLTARENIALKRVLTEPVYPAEKIDEMAELLGLDHVLNQPTSLCSYGEQQRIAIIRALMQPFDWLIMDEPFSHLDKANTHKAAALIDVECKKRNAGLLITDLDTNEQHVAYEQVYQL